MRRILLAILFIFLLSIRCHSEDVTLAWTQSTSPNLCGNKVYYGYEPEVYPVVIVLPVQTEYKIENLRPGTYFFTVTAFDCNGNESPYATSFYDPTKNYVTKTLYSKCDLNKDGSVNALDLQTMINSILDQTSNDLNGDGETNVLDLQVLANKINGTGSCP